VADGVYTSDVTVTLKAAGAGDRVEYSFDASNWVKYTGPFTVSGEGKKTIYARTVSDNGSVEPADSITFSISKPASKSPSFIAGSLILPLAIVAVTGLLMMRRRD
jgi:hypothetical protein